jgi:23S rRNA G2069 N7-methylase RlmK/C1962 C5-methylase RlmI
VDAALPLLKSGGVMLAATNAADLKPERFLGMARDAVQSVNRRILREHYVPQPPDFPVTREEPAHLKTVWLRVE